jgi:hypothetical protein
MIIDARSDTFSDAGGAIQWWTDQREPKSQCRCTVSYIGTITGCSMN